MHTFLKPTAFGMDIDYDHALSTVSELAKLASDYDIFVRLDMEDSDHTESTLMMIEDLEANGT